MKTIKTWTEADYDEMSWHDNYVYGIQIQETDHGFGELALSLDYILEWVRPNKTEYRFRIAPATLTFIDVFNLRITLDYEKPTAGMSPFSISRISREAMPTPTGKKYYKWIIGINWPEGEITFEASGFRQNLIGNIVETDQQLLTKEQRENAKKTVNNAIEPTGD